MSKASKVLNLDIINDLSSTTARRRFFAAFSFIAVISLGIYTLPIFLEINDEFSELIKSTAVEIFSACLIILVIFWVYVFFIGEDSERSEIETIRPGDINEEIKKLPDETTFYYLWARSSAYFRSETLRALDSYSKKSRKTVDVIVLLPDPEIEEISIAYEHTIASLGEQRSSDKLFKNAVATSAACAILAASNRNLRVKVCFSKFLPSFRVDMAERGALITEDDKRLYGLRFSRSSQFFEMFRNMIIYEVEISREVDLKNYNWRQHELESQDIPVEALRSLGFECEKLDECREEIFSLMASRDHRYA